MHPKQLFQRLRSTRPFATLTSQHAYAQWADNYPPHAHNRFMEIEEVTLQSLLPNLTGKTVVDVACGTGRWGHIAQQRGAALVLGADNSHAMLRASILPLNVQAEQFALPIATGWADVVICGLAIGHIPDELMQQTVGEIGRILKAHGVALVSDVHPFQAWAGAQRTFTGSDGKIYAVEHYPHSYADFFAAAEKASMVIDAVREPTLPESPDTPPVALVLRFRKLP